MSRDDEWARACTNDVWSHGLMKACAAGGTPLSFGLLIW